MALGVAAAYGGQLAIGTEAGSGQGLWKDAMMAKRFTETAKWNDPWFRRLQPEHKLAWSYVCDLCDHAGVIDLDTELASFQIGCDINWCEFRTAVGDRIVDLNDSKWLVVGFIGFQYGELSEGCNAHKPVFHSIEKHSLWHTLQGEYLKGTQRDQDNTKTKTKGGVGGKRFSPPSVEDVASYVAEMGYSFDPEAFVAHYAARNWYLSNNRKMADWKSACVTWQKNAAKFKGQDAKTRPQDVDLRL